MKERIKEEAGESSRVGAWPCSPLTESSAREQEAVASYCKYCRYCSAVAGGAVQYARRR